MLRDIPRIYFLMFGFVGAIVLLSVWYLNSFQRGSDTMVLNEAILSSAVSEVDQASRMYEGVLLLSDSFETTVWDAIQEEYPKGSAVQFDYRFITDDSRFGAIESKTVSSPTYYVQSDNAADRPAPEKMGYMLGRPVENVRVKVRAEGDKVGEWTYVSTVAVDAASRD